MSNDDDYKIVSKCQAGDSDAFAVLYDAYIDSIYRFIYYRTMHRQTAEDLVSQTFCKALENISSFNRGKGAFRSWLYSIARNLVIDHYRTRKHTEDIDTVWGLSSDEDIARETDNLRELERVTQHLGKIPPQQREIIIFRLWDQLSYYEIAQITGKSEASCKMAFSRAIVRLRELITQK